MRIKKRLQVNVAVSVLTAFVICLVLFSALYRLNRASNSAKVADEIITSVLERVTLRNDYIRNNSVRAKEQWFAKHEQIGKLLKQASENFRDSEDRKNIAEFIEDHESIGNIFSAIVANRERAGLNSGSASLSREVEERLLSQLNMRVYDVVIHSRELLESSRQARDSALRLAGGGIISVLLILIAAAMISSWTMGRAITDRAGLLRYGASLIGSGDLDHRIDVKGDDEFAEIAAAFNAMTAKLSGSYHDLENEINERRRAGELLRNAHDELEQRVEERTLELKVASAYNRSLIEASLDPLVTIGYDGKITDVNAATEAATGRSRTELIGTDFCDYFSEPEKARAGYEQVFREGSIRDYALELRHRDGHIISVLYNATVYSEEGGKIVGIFAAARDISAQKQAENALLELNDNLEEQVIERTAQLKSANETLRASRVAALNLMEDAVNARKEAEKTAVELRERERSLAEIVEKSPSFVCILRGPDHVFEMANEKYLRVIGKRDILGKKLIEAVPEITDSPYPQILDRVYKTGEPFTANDVSIMLARGVNGKLEEVWLDFVYLPLRELDGTISGVFVHGVDNTERKRAEIALRTSSQRSNLLAETTAKLLASDSPQSVVDDLCRKVMEALDCQAFFNFLVDEKADRLRLNACAGIPEEEVKKLEWLDYGIAVCGCAARDATRIVAEDIPNTPDPRTELVKSYGIQAYACHPLMAQGRVLGTLSFGTRNRPCFTKDELALMKLVTDHVAIAMERKLAEEDLKLARIAAEAASRAKSQFLANMSHELRTPMTGILGMLEFTLNTTLDAQQRDFIETARKSGRTLLQILNDILDLAKVEAGKLSIEAKPFVLRDCVAGAIDVLVPEARRKGLVLNCAMADDLPKIVVGDQVRLLQVLTNLCGNAVKFTEKGEVGIKVTNGRQTPEGKREIAFAVRDTGIGIPADKRELIFGSFDQADISHTRRYGGTGLGLAICRELVERMGGTISCVSEEGRGSTFSFAVPLEEALKESETVSMPNAPVLAVSVPVSSSEKKKARLLLAEDDPITRQVIGLMLKHSQFDHDTAENGLQAVEMWEKGKYDLILMDVQMPGMDGFAATGAIREREQGSGGHTIIVAMTAHAFPEDEKRCLDAGMDAYIPKPIDLKKCMAMIEEIIWKGE